MGGDGIRIDDLLCAGDVTRAEGSAHFEGKKIRWHRQQKKQTANRFQDQSNRPCFPIVQIMHTDLNWMVEGVAALRRSGDSIDPQPEMLRRIDELIQESDACLAFVKNCVVHTRNTEDVLFSFGLYNAFTASSYFVGSGSKQIIRTKLKKAMKDVYGVEEPRHDLKDSDGKAKYGYVGYRLELNGPE